MSVYTEIFKANSFGAAGVTVYKRTGNQLVSELPRAVPATVLSQH